ncbi:MAG: hypothetical protein AAGA54_28680 [Myxococcota bacterium]
MAWVEYQDSGDGVVFTHACTSRLRFKNAFAALPRTSSSSRNRVASNAADSKFTVHTFSDHGKARRSGLLAVPHIRDNAVFERWVSNPGIADGKLVSDPGAPTQVDLLVLSGHGGGGDVWGDVSGSKARISPPHAFQINEDDTRSGRLVCLITPACTNLNLGLAPLWLSAFKHPQPLHVVLGYEDRYSGGAFGARALAKFADTIARNRKMPIIEAWRRANESIRPAQPWAAIAALAGEGLNLHDWVRGDLPPLSNVETLLHFSGDHPGGQEAPLTDPNYEVRWVMHDAARTVISMDNNVPGNEEVGLFEGKPGTIRIRAKRREKDLEQGQEIYLHIYQYRRSKLFDITDLLTFDADLLRPHPATGVPVVRLEKDRITPRERQKRKVPMFDTVRIVVPEPTDRLELRFNVNPSATKTLKPTGPAGTHGRYVLDLIHRPVLMEEDGFEIVTPLSNGRSFAATAGALLRP